MKCRSGRATKDPSSACRFKIRYIGPEFKKEIKKLSIFSESRSKWRKKEIRFNRGMQRNV